MYGELVPVGGGDPIPLLKSNLMVGRRESCDIVLRFGNVSGQHCELILDRGWWFVKDLNSQNGTRVNGLRVSKKRMDPGDRLTIARNDYEVRYSPAANGGDETNPPEDDVFADIMGRSLLESAGLHRRDKQSTDGKIGRRKSSAAAAAAAAAGSDQPADTAADEPSSSVDPEDVTSPNQPESAETEPDSQSN